MKKSSFAIASAFALLMSFPALADNNTNTSNIDQVGSALSATATQGGDTNINSSAINQIGSTISAAVTQDGNNNGSDVTINQGLNVSGSNLSATIHQGGSFTTNAAT